MSRSAFVLVTIFLAIVAAAAGAALAVYQDSRPPAEVEPIRPAATPTVFPRLTAQLARADGRILVTNLDEDPWSGCIVDLNAGVPGGGYSRELGDLAAGEQGSLELDAFARADGRRFDPDAERVQVVDLHCGTPSGQAHFSGGL